MTAKVQIHAEVHVQIELLLKWLKKLALPAVLAVAVYGSASLELARPDRLSYAV